jgi:hypothetical protein
MKRQRLERRLRGDLIWFGVGFVVLQIALAAGVEWFWPRVRDPEYAFKERRLRARLAELPQRPLVLALGSSRTQMGLHAARLSHTADQPLVFNFGIPGAGPMMQQVCLKRLLSAGVRPQFALIEIMPLYYNERDGCPLEEKSLDSARLQGREVVLLGRYYEGLNRLLLRWTGARLMPCYRHQAEIRDALGLDQPAPGSERSDPESGMDAHGWQPHFVELTPERREELTRYALGQYADAAVHFRLAKGQTKALRDLLWLCRQQRIPAALILMPEGSRFRALSSGGVLRQLEEFLQRVSRDYGVPIIDARTWVEDQHFWDSHHLLPTGAVVLTERLEREALRPLLAQRSGSDALRSSER